MKTFPPWPATRVDVAAVVVVVVADAVVVVVAVAAEWSARAKAREGRCDAVNAAAVDAAAAAASGAVDAAAVAAEGAGVATAGWRRVHGRWTERLAGMEKDHGGC